MANARYCRSGAENNQNGFTLAELMIVMVITSVIMAAVFMIYLVHQRSYVEQDDLADIQQNLRGALAVMTPEIRQAGCNPTRSSGIGIVQATSSIFHFTSDVGGDPINQNQADGDVDDANEDITLGFSAANDANGNGIADGGGADWSTPVSLGRDTGGGFQAMAENIEAVEFNYILDGGTATNNSGIATATQTNAPIANLNDIRAVQISILGRAANPAKDFRHNQSYTTASGVVWTPPLDSFRRRMVIVNIQCRNMGL